MYKRQFGDDEEEKRQTERLVILIKPDYVEHADEVIRDLRSAEFGLIMRRSEYLSREKAEDWTGNQLDSERLCSGASLLLLMQHRNNGFQLAAGIARCHNEGRHVSPSHSPFRLDDSSVVYASGDMIAAERDRRFFFPDVPVTFDIHDQLRDYMDTQVWPILGRALTALAIQRPSDPILWLSKWLKHNRI